MGGKAEVLSGLYGFGVRSPGYLAKSIYSYGN